MATQSCAHASMCVRASRSGMDTRTMYWTATLSGSCISEMVSTGFRAMSSEKLAFRLDRAHGAARLCQMKRFIALTAEQKWTLATNGSLAMSINEAMRIETLLSRAEVLRNEVEALRERLAGVADEVSSVLQLLDGLAEQWGDEAVFRRCRDRLRKVVNEQ